MASRTSYASSIKYVRSDVWVCSRSQGQPSGARSRAWRATNFLNHAPGSREPAPFLPFFGDILFRTPGLDLPADFLRVAICLPRKSDPAKRNTLRCRSAFYKRAGRAFAFATQRWAAMLDFETYILVLGN